MKYILLTGGSGFVGRNLIEYFETHYPEEFVIDAPRSKDLNVLDRNQVESWLLGKEEASSIPPGEKYDIVLHFAVYTDAVDKSKDGSKMYEYNKQSFLNFFENRHLCKKLFYAGSGAEFNKTSPIVSVTEDDLISREIPTDPYGSMKYECGQLLETGENTYNLRIFGLFGKYEYPNRLITYLCHKSIDGQAFELNQDVYFDYLYIDDFCKMVHEIISKEEPDYHTYNMVSGSRVNLLSLVDIVNDIAIKRGKAAQPVKVRKEGLNLEYTASCRRFLQEFSDFQFLSIEESVERLYEIYEEDKRRENQADCEGCNQGTDAGKITGQNPGKGSLQNAETEKGNRCREAGERRKGENPQGAEEEKCCGNARSSGHPGSTTGCKKTGGSSAKAPEEGRNQTAEEPDQKNSQADQTCISCSNPDQNRTVPVSPLEAQKAGKDRGEGPSEEEIIKMLDALADGGASRMAIKVSADLEAGSSRKDYHHGRCDVGSPFATGKLYDFEDGCD